MDAFDAVVFSLRLLWDGLFHLKGSDLDDFKKELKLMSPAEMVGAAIRILLVSGIIIGVQIGVWKLIDLAVNAIGPIVVLGALGLGYVVYFAVDLDEGEG